MGRYAGKYWVEVAEFEVWGVEAQLSGSVVASSGVYGVGFEGSKVVDGDVGTCWISPGTTSVREEYVVVDLGGVKGISRVRLLPRGGFAYLFPTVFTVQVSSDQVNWATVVSEGSYSPVEGVWYEKSFSVQSGRYVRFGGMGRYAGKYWVEVGEMQVYGAEAAVCLSWTAPGDNGVVGTATSYEVKYSTVGAITDETKWTAATAITSGVPTPSVAGMAQSMTLPASALPGETLVWFSVRAVDEVGNRGGLSNSPSVSTPGVAPAAVANLTASNATATGFTVSFTAVGDDGSIGIATAYDVRCSTSVLTEANWANAVQMTGEWSGGRHDVLCWDESGGRGGELVWVVECGDDQDGG
jgi:hypothetical protein